MELKKIIFDDTSKLSNLTFISFHGQANGSNLTKSGNVQYLRQNYLKLKYIDIHYFTDNIIWTNKGYWDNKLATPNANTRYDLVNPNMRIDLLQHESYINANAYNLLIDGHQINLFPSAFGMANYTMPLLEHLEINAYLDSLLQDTIDFQVNCQLLKDYEANTFNNPFVLVSMLIEKLGNKKENAIQF